MKRLLHLINTGLFDLTICSIIGLVVVPTLCNAQPEPARATLSQAELDQLLAPIALYPDTLLSHVLVAATYPQDVAQASKYAQGNLSVTKNPSALAREMEKQQWDPSVKFLAQFPDVLAMMNSQPDWMQRLGDSFLGQQAVVMNTVQKLRSRAMEQGSLIGCHQKVKIQSGAIIVEPSAVNEIYVPYYNPTVVYGLWWQPNYVPFVWLPPIEFRPVYLSTGFVFGSAVVIADPLLFPIYPDWRRHHLAFGSWGGRSGWRAGTPWRPDMDRRAAALSSRPAANQGRLQQHGLVNNRAPLSQQGARFSQATGQFRSPSNRGNNRASMAQPRMQQHGGFSHGGPGGPAGFTRSHGGPHSGGGSHPGGGSHSGGGNSHHR